MLIAAAGTFTVAILPFDIAKRGRIKFIHRERHVLEHLARIIRGGGDAFFFGNSVFRAVNEILRGTLNTHDGEEAKGDGQHLGGGLAAHSAAEAAANDIGQVLRADAGTAAIACLCDPCAENDGVYDFKHGAREIGAGDFRGAAGAEILLAKLALENIDVPFAAVKDDLLFHDGDAFDLLRSANARADLGGDLDIHGDTYLIKTPIEGNGVNVYVRADDLRALCADGAASFQNIVAGIREIYGNLLKAVFVPTAIKDPMGVYIYGRITTHLRSVSHIRHIISSDSYFWKTKNRFLAISYARPEKVCGKSACRPR